MHHGGRSDLDLRSDAQTVFEEFDDVGSGNELGNGRQVVERVEAELFKKNVCRTEQHCLAGSVVSADLFDIASGRQGSNDAVRINTTDGTDLGTRNWLLVRDDGQCLQCSSRESRALIVEQETLDVGRQVGCRLIPESTRDSGQFETVLGFAVCRSKLFAPLIDEGGRLLDELSQHFRWHRVMGNENNGFDRSFERGNLIVDRDENLVGQAALNISRSALGRRSHGGVGFSWGKFSHVSPRRRRSGWCWNRSRRPSTR